MSLLLRLDNCSTELMYESLRSLVKVVTRFTLCALFLVILIPIKSFATESKNLVLGAEQTDLYLPLLKGKRVGLIVNQTSTTTDVNGNQQHLVDHLVRHDINIVRLFAPEHGIRGDHSAGEKVKSSKDTKTGIDIVSIYGASKRPMPKHIKDLDVLVFDIQDVGARFYTYINSMFYMMQAAKQHGIPFVVLDRPNPNIDMISGPMLDPEFSSFVGLLPIPMIHGLTVGELAKMIVGENWLEKIEPLQQALKSGNSFSSRTENISDSDSESEFATDATAPKQLALTVIPVKHYHRTMRYQLPIPPSPNLPNHQAVRLYPSLCLFEATPISIGRGTDFPFQVIGHNQVYFGDFEFVPTSRPKASKHPKLENQKATGVDLRNVQVNGFTLSYLLKWHQLFVDKDQTFFTRAGFFDKLAGTDSLRKQIKAGWTESQITASWEKQIQAFKKLRSPYLLYPKTPKE